MPNGVSSIEASVAFPVYTIRRTVPEVRLQFTVADSRGQLVSDLSSGEVRILDNSTSVAQIRSFSRLRDLPLQAGILLDVSDSVQKTALRQRRATQYFVQHVLHSQTDRAALLAFSSELKLWQPYTGDRAALDHALTAVAQPGFATYLFDGVVRACREQFSAAPDGEFAQRVLVLITDGNDTGSLHSLHDAIATAQQREVQIFAISVHSPKIHPRGDAVLQHLVEATGGALYVAANEKGFPALFAAMEQQMRTQYAVTFQPADQTGGFHEVKISIADGTQLRVRARSGYFYAAP